MMTDKNNDLTPKEQELFDACVKDIFDKIKGVLEEDSRTDYSSRVYFIGRSIARMQMSDIEIAQCLRNIINAFSDELVDYKDFRKNENQKMLESLNKFRQSAGEEVNYFDTEVEESRTVN